MLRLASHRLHPLRQKEVSAMTNLKTIANTLRTIQTRTLKANRNEDRDTSIIANTEAAIHLGEAAASIDKAIQALVPFNIAPAASKREPTRTRTEPQTRKGNVTPQAGDDDWNLGTTTGLKAAS